MRTAHHNPSELEFQGRLRQSYHLEMVRDRQRVNAIRSAIDVVADRSANFLELGCGSGLFTKYAAGKFAAAIGVEGDPRMYDIASRHCGVSNGTSDGVLHGDALKMEFPIKFDVLLCEMLSTWLVTEPQVPVLRFARERFLNVSPKSIIPRRVINLFELGSFEFGNDLVTLTVAIPQFTGVTPPTIITESKVANEIDFERGELPEEMTGSITIRALADCVVNAARLSSIIDLAPGVSFYSTDTLMPPIIAPVTPACRVLRGEELLFSYRYRHMTPIEEIRLSVLRK